MKPGGLRLFAASAAILGALSMPSTALAGGGGGLCGGNSPSNSGPIGIGAAQVFRFSGLHVQAIWQTANPDGSSESVFVGAQQQPSGAPEIFVQDFVQDANGAPTFIGDSTSIAVQSLQISNDLSAAAMDATAQLTDELGSTASPSLKVRINWTASGPLQHASNHSSPPGTGQLFLASANALCQPSTASGSVQDLSTFRELAGRAADFAEIDRTVQNFVILAP